MLIIVVVVVVVDEGAGGPEGVGEEGGHWHHLCVRGLTTVTVITVTTATTITTVTVLVGTRRSIPSIAHISFPSSSWQVCCWLLSSFFVRDLVSALVLVFAPLFCLPDAHKVV